MTKRAFLVLALLSVSLALDAFTSFEYDDNLGVAKIFFYEFNPDAPGAIEGVPSPQVEEVSILIDPLNDNPPIRLACNPAPASETVNIGNTMIDLEGYSCQFQPPKDVKDSCALFSIEFVGTGPEGRMRLSTPFQRVCSAALSYDDSLIAMLRSMGIFDINNPICFSTLVVLALFITMYYARNKGAQFSLLYDLIYPKVFKPPERKYSLRGPSPVSSLTKEASKAKEMLGKRLAKMLGLAIGAPESEIKRAFIRRMAELGIPIREGASLQEILDAAYRYFETHPEARGENYELFRAMAQYMSIGATLESILRSKPSRFADLLDKMHNALNFEKKRGVLKLMGKAWGYSFMPFTLASKGIRMGVRTAGVAGRAFLGQTLVGPALTGAYVGAKKARRRVLRKRGITEQAEETGPRLFGKVNELFETEAMRFERKLAYFNYSESLHLTLRKTEENIKRTLFFDVIAEASGLDAKQIRELFSEMLVGNASDARRIREKIHDLLSSINFSQPDVVDDVLGAIMRMRWNDESSLRDVVDGLTRLGMHGHAEHISALAEISGNQNLNDDARAFSFLTYSTSTLAVFLEENSLRPFIGVTESREANLEFQRFVDNAYNIASEVYGDPNTSNLQDILLNSADYVIATDLAKRYGVGDAEVVAEFNRLLVSSEGNEGLAKHVEEDARNSASLVDAILRDMFRRTSEEGFTVEDEKLRAFMREVESPAGTPERIYDPFYFLNNKREAKSNIEADLEHLNQSDPRRAVEIIGRCNKLVDFLGVSAGTKIREPYREGYRGFRWNVITRENVEQLKNEGIGKTIFEAGLYESVSFATSAYNAATGITEGPIGTAVVENQEATNNFFNGLGRQLLESGVPEDAVHFLLQRLASNRSNILAGSDGAEISKNTISELKDALRTLGYGRKQVNEIVKSLKNPLMELSRNYLEESTSNTLALFHASHINLMKGMYVTDTNNTQEAGYDGQVFIRDSYVHALMFAEMMLERGGSTTEGVDALNEKFEYLQSLPDRNLTTGMLDQLSEKGIYMIRTTSGTFMPVFSDAMEERGRSPNRERAATLLKEIGKNLSGYGAPYSARTMELFSESINQNTLNSLLKALPAGYSLVGLEKQTLIYNEKGVIKTKDFIEIPPATFYDIEEVHERASSYFEGRQDVLEAFERVRSVLREISSQNVHGERRVSPSERLKQHKEDFITVIRAIRELVERQPISDFRVQPELMVMIARSYMESTRDPSLLFGELHEFVVGPRQVIDRVYMARVRELSERANDSTEGLHSSFVQKAFHLKELLGRNLKAAKDFVVSSAGMSMNYYFPSRGSELTSMQNEVAKYALMDTWEYAEKKLAELKASETPDPEEVKFFTELKETIETQLTKYSFYFSRDKYYMYGGLSGSKELALEKQDHFRGAYAGTSLLFSLVDIQGKEMFSKTMAGPLLGGFYTEAVKGAAYVAEIFRKPAALARKASERALGLPGITDMRYELYDAELRKRLEERYGRMAISIPQVNKAKDLADHWTKAQVHARQAYAFREMLAHTLGFGLIPGAIIGSTLFGAVGVAVAGVGLAAMSHKKTRQKVGSLFEKFLNKVNTEEMRSFISFDELHWRVITGSMRYSWMTREAGKVMGGGAKSIPGLSYHLATTEEFRPSPGVRSAYRAYARILREEQGIKTPEYVAGEESPFGGTRFTLSLVNKLEEQYKELEGYGPSYNFAYGLVSPAFLINFVGAQLSMSYMKKAYEVRAKAMQERQRREAQGETLSFSQIRKRETIAGTIGIGASLVKGGASLAAASFMPLPAIVSTGSVFISGMLAKNGYIIKCGRCGEMKKRGRPCQHCGFNPSYGNI